MFPDGSYVQPEFRSANHEPGQGGEREGQVGERILPKKERTNHGRVGQRAEVQRLKSVDALQGVASSKHSAQGVAGGADNEQVHGDADHDLIGAERDCVKAERQTKYDAA